jgi:hypothetical protein
VTWSRVECLLVWKVLFVFPNKSTFGNACGDHDMSTTRDPGLVFEFGVVLAIYAAFIIAYLLFTGFFNLVLLQYLTIAVIVTATVLLFYRAYVKKQMVVFVSGFTIIGMLLLSMSTIITVPFKTTESYPSTYSSNWYNNTIALNPRESKNVSLSDEFGLPLDANGTVVQLRFSNSGGLRIRLYYRSYSEEKLGLNESFGTSGWAVGTVWNNIYWAPVGPISESPYWDSLGYIRRWDQYYSITVNLENRETSSEQVILRVNFYDFAATANKEIIKYRPAIDYYFGYLGVALLTTAVVLELLTWQKWRTSSPILQNKTTPLSQNHVVKCTS